MINEENKKLNGTFLYYKKIQDLDFLQNYPEFRELLTSSLHYVFNNALGFDMFSTIIQHHIDETGDDDLFFVLQDFREEVHTYLTKKENIK